MKKVLSLLRTLALIVLPIIFSACGSKAGPLNAAPETGTLLLSVSLVAPAQSALARASQTSGNRLILLIDAPDMAPLVDTITLTPGQAAVSHAISGVTPGSDRRIMVWTANAANGLTVHSPVIKTVDVTAGGTAALSLTLLPSRGSIYFSFHDIDKKVDSVAILFAVTADTFRTKAAVAAGNQIQLSLDYIPDNTSGTLFVYGIRDTLPTPDTLYRFTRSYRFHAGLDSTLSAAFSVTPGGFSLTVSAALPGVTLVEGAMNSGALRDSTEAGPLFISEIMYNTNDSEYVEVYNPGLADVVFDTLILEVNNKYWKFTNVTVPANDFLVIGRHAYPYADIWHTTLTALDLASTYEYIALRQKDSTLMDAIAFTGSTNALEWPVLPSGAKASIELDSLGGPGYNNYGKNWRPATTLIPGTGMKGTPGF
ncbi:MAG: hypothetical protein V1913_02755 [Fibrobacterota bacterium]